MYKSSLKQFRTNVPEKKKNHNWKLWFGVFLVVLVCGGIVYFLNLPDFKIKDVKIEGAVLTRENDIKSIVDESINSSYFFLVPRSHIWFFPRWDIKEKIEKESSVTGVSLTIDEANVLHIKVSERKQDYLWCNTEKMCFYMDKEGLVFAAAPTFEGNLFLTFSGLIEGDPIGKSFLPKEKMETFIAFIEGLKKFGLPPVSIDAISRSEVRIILQSDSVLVVSLDDDLDMVSKNIATLLESSDFIKASGGINNLEYIDFRYGAKAFWKEKGKGVSNK